MPITVVSACLMEDKSIRKLGGILYNARKTHFGIEHARDWKNELKGTQLFSNYSFKQAEEHGKSTNHSLAEQIFDKCEEANAEFPIWLYAAVVYRAVKILSQLNPHRLNDPVADMLDKISATAQATSTHRRVNLVFDSQICGAEPQIAANVQKFVAGVKLPNVSHYPLGGVSHVTPGIQLADICAHILGRKASGDSRFDPWIVRLQKMQWCGDLNGVYVRGIEFWTTEERQLKRCQAWQ